MGPNWFLWVLKCLDSCLLFLMVSYESVYVLIFFWIPMGPNGSVWVLMSPYETLWVLIDPHRFLCVLMGRLGPYWY